MKYTLTKNPNGWEGPREDGKVIQYEVGDMPKDELGVILRHGSEDWRVRRFKSRKLEYEKGPFDSPDAALDALQAEIDDEEKKNL